MKIRYNIIKSTILSIFITLNSFASDIIITPLEFNCPDVDFHIEKVILSQSEKIVVGFVYDEYGRKGIDLGNYIEVTLNEYLTTKVPPKEGSKPMILRVNKLVMTGSGTVNYTELGVSFIERKDSTYLTHLHTGTITQRNLDRKIINHPIYRGQNLVQALESCFEDYVKRLEKSQLLHLKITEEQLNQPPVFDADNYPILGEQLMLKGIIYSYSDFLHQDIDFSNSRFTITPIEKEPLTPIDPVKVEFAVQPQPHWGITDGERYYRKIGRNYHPIEFKENTLQIRNYRSYFRSESNEGVNVVSAVAPLFGLLGLIVAIAIEDNSSESSQAFDDLETESLEYLTGSIIPLPERSDIILEMHMRNSDESLCIYHRDEKLGCIKNGEYLRFRPKIDDGIVHLTAVPDNGTRKVQIRFNPAHHQRFNFYFRKGKLMFADRGFIPVYELNHHLISMEEVESYFKFDAEVE